MFEEKALINLDEPIDKYLKRWHLPKVSLLKIIVQLETISESYSWYKSRWF
jgi:hypothetical protein